MQTKQPNKQNLLIFILLLITVVAVSVTVWALFFRTTDAALVPDHAPVVEEANAQPIPGDSGKGEAAEPGSGNVSLSYSNQVTIDLSTKTVRLIFVTVSSSYPSSFFSSRSSSLDCNPIKTNRKKLNPYDQRLLL